MTDFLAYLWEGITLLWEALGMFWSISPVGCILGVLIIALFVAAGWAWTKTPTPGLDRDMYLLDEDSIL